MPTPQVAGLLGQEQLNSVFLNVGELITANLQLTESLKDSIEIALEDGDEDLCSVCIGRTFLKAAGEAGMLAAFKNYCTRQVRARRD